MSLTVGELKKLLELHPENQPIMIQVDDENGSFCKEVKTVSNEALWTGPNRDVREMQLYLHIFVPLSPEVAE